MDKTIGVHHEWGALKEVIIGIGDTLAWPSYDEKVSFIYDPTYIDLMKQYGGKKAMEVDPKATQTVMLQINGLASTLEEKGIIVHRPKPLDAMETQYMGYVQQGQMQLYARDPILVISNHVIETALKVPMRAKERYGLRAILKERLKGSDANYVALPAVSPNFGEDEIYLEGGDVLLNGRDIYVGNSGRGSNPAGIAWLQNYLGDNYRVHEIKLSNAFEHLDCVLALLRPGLGIIYSKGILSELPKSLQGWDFIEVTEDEVKRLAANAFVLDDQTAIIDSQHHRIAEELRARGHKIIELPYDQVATWGGAFRCSHHPLRRES